VQHVESLHLRARPLCLLAHIYMQPGEQETGVRRARHEGALNEFVAASFDAINPLTTSSFQTLSA
jgi:hypothetical protein